MQDLPPILAIDVDGVLCPVLVPGEEPLTTWPIWAHAPELTVSMSKGLIEYLQSLEARKQVRPGWLTTWQERAPERLAPAFRLPTWPVLSTEAEFLSEGWWKLATVRRLIDQGNRVIWLDDDLEYSRSLGELDELLTTGLLTYVSPTFTIGLTPEDLADLDELLEDL